MLKRIKWRLVLWALFQHDHLYWKCRFLWSARLNLFLLGMLK